MSERRIAKANQAILETVSTVILLHLRDPRVKNVTVLGVDVAPDLRSAKIAVSIMGSAKEQSLCLHGLESARGFLQSKVADRLQTKNTPVLKFVLDPSVKKSIEASQLIREVLPEGTEAEANAGRDGGQLDEEGTGEGDELTEDHDGDDDAGEEDEDEEDAAGEDSRNRSQPPAGD